MPGDRLSPERECDICGHSFSGGDADDRLCSLCSACELARISEGAPATPRYHRDRRIN